MKCLVTKLKGTVSNDSLLKIGELRIRQGVIQSPSANTQYMKVSSVGKITAKVSNGHFTDSSLVQNLGQELVNDTIAHLTVSNSDCTISLFDKYNITELICKNSSVKVIADSLKFCKNLAVLEAGIEGDISCLEDSPIEQLIVQNKEAIGNISVLAGKLNGESNSVTLASPNLTGDIAVFNNKNISILNLGGSGITGSIEGFNLPATTWLTIPKGVTGRIEMFTSSKCNIILRGSNVTGDISRVNGISKIIGPISFNWGDGTPSNFVSLDMVTLATIAELDRMLIKEAELVTSTSGNDLIINVSCHEGNRTTASDSAVSTLKSKGVSITINGATL